VTALRAEGLRVHFGTGQRTLVAVDEVDLDLADGQVFGLVGESGSGKSTLARALAGIAPVGAGRVLLDGHDLARLPAAQRKALRRRVQLVFQDPYASLNPRMTVGETLGEALAARRRGGRGERRRRIAELLELVTLDERHAGLLPRELSGGQRQRVAIARALAAEPGILIADEITSALDVSVQGAVLNLIRDIRARLGLSILFISHNLALVRYVSDVIAVMYLGRIVEVGPAEELVARPRHPYTRALLDAAPRLGAAGLGPAGTLPAGTLPAGTLPAGAGAGAGAAAGEPSVLDADPADPHRPPSGCHFHPRCPVGPLIISARVACATEDPRSGSAGRSHRAACHFADAPDRP
jgi:peptide/nickel transport system ATP-binding protein